MTAMRISRFSGRPRQGHAVALIQAPKARARIMRYEGTDHELAAIEARRLGMKRLRPPGANARNPDHVK
jgi:hypothetical protein